MPTVGEASRSTTILWGENRDDGRRHVRQLRTCHHKALEDPKVRVENDTPRGFPLRHKRLSLLSSPPLTADRSRLQWQRRRRRDVAATLSLCRPRSPRQAPAPPAPRGLEGVPVVWYGLSDEQVERYDDFVQLLQQVPRARRPAVSAFALEEAMRRQRAVPHVARRAHLRAPCGSGADCVCGVSPAAALHEALQSPLLRVTHGGLIVAARIGTPDSEPPLEPGWSLDFSRAGRPIVAALEPGGFAWEAGVCVGMEVRSIGGSLCYMPGEAAAVFRHSSGAVVVVLELPQRLLRRRAEVLASERTARLALARGAAAAAEALRRECLAVAEGAERRSLVARSRTAEADLEEAALRRRMKSVGSDLWVRSPR
eukprot:TRINITY_DN28671_c0_g1_i1.p1 TRINITY_DN28671_c0_g1~~TRINITY_DN28671_c0_g1_i1.p1  ORF type:complete len:392 (+),score=121.36 TRINITY_DN28671_c0_g1_i1:71-1177(+)